ncbi:MAG: hypothetical protein Q8P68_03445 [Candidatus Peregrinibacteria bacterium]|nr:hypothetical protein [Candidatus Peregrinibacteria bacterium]
MNSAYRKYASGRQTLYELGKELQVCPKTLRKHFDRHYPITGEIKVSERPVNLVMDATFFKRGDGVMVLRANGKNLLWREVETEKADDYEELISGLQFAGTVFSSFTIDGKRGVLHMLLRKFPGVPVQYCQFHQMQTITIYLSKKPKLEAGKELRRLALTLPETDRKTFTDDLNKWHEKWESFLGEKSVDPLTRRWHFTHRRLKSAYRSLKTNLPYLFTYLDFHELKIPNTTNSCDGSFAHWKGKLGVHRGLAKKRKQKMMHYLLENS